MTPNEVLSIYLLLGIASLIGYFRYSYEHWYHSIDPTTYEDGGTCLEYTQYCNFDTAYWVWSMFWLGVIQIILWPHTLYGKRPFEFAEVAND